MSVAPTPGDDPWDAPPKWHDGVTRVIVAEEAALLRRRLAVVLGDEPDLEVMADVADGDGLLARAVELVPDVVVVGLGLPPTGAAGSVAALREVLPGVEVVVVGPDGDPAAIRAVTSGAIAVIAGRSAADRAAAVARQAARRRPVLPLAVAAGVIAEYDRRARRRPGAQGEPAPPELAPGERASLLAAADDALPGEDPVGGSRRAASARNALERLARHTRDEAVLGAPAPSDAA
jgi:DNA-binding NarL/FixJ family response regulator